MPVRGGRELGGGWSEKVRKDAIEAIYGSSTDPGLWTRVLEIVGAGVDSSVSAVHIQARESRRARTVAFHGDAGDARVREYESYYSTRNVWLEHGAHLLTPGAVLTGDEMCGDEILLRSEFYNDFLRRMDVRYSVRAVLASGAERLEYVSFGRPHRSRPFGESTRVKIRQLAPHFAQALRIHARLEGVEARRRAAGEALASLSAGVFFLDAQGRVIEMNRAGRRIVESRDGLAIERGALAARESASEVRLQRLILGAASGHAEGPLPLGGAMSIPREGGQAPLSATVIPTRITCLLADETNAAVVVLVELPAERRVDALDAFASSYGLSRSEAALTQRLLSGMSLRHAAVVMGIRENTARSHLKRVFQKTGAHRQGDLIRRALTYDPGCGGTS